MSTAIMARLKIEPSGANGFTLRVYALQSAKDEWFKWYDSELAAYIAADELGFTTNRQAPQGKVMHIGRQLKEEVPVDPSRLIECGFERVEG
jgi:hypothetical protein